MDEILNYRVKAKASLNIARMRYQYAIQRYGAMRDWYLSTLPSLQQEIAQKKAQIFTEKVNMYMSKNIEGQELLTRQNLDTLQMRLSLIASDILTGNPVLIHQTVQQGTTKLSKKTKDKGPEAIINRLRKTLAQELNKEIQQFSNQVQAVYQSTFKTTSLPRQASVDALYSIIRKQLISKAMTQAQTASLDAGYLKVFRGDFLEALGESAINMAYPDSAIQTGANKSVNSRSSQYDIVIGPGAKHMPKSMLDDILQHFDLLNKTVNIKHNLLSGIDYNYIGGQVKSWAPPSKNKPNTRNFLDVGKHKDLWDKYGFNSTTPGYKRGWHYSAQVLGQNIFEVLGAQQAFYILAGQFTWTSDLIQSLMDQKYYLTFYFAHPNAEEGYQYGPDNKYAGQVAWQQQKIMLGRRANRVRASLKLANQ